VTHAAAGSSVLHQCCGERENVRDVLEGGERTAQGDLVAVSEPRASAYKICNTLVRYGVFTGLSCVGSVLGVVTWMAYMRFILALFEATHIVLKGGAAEFARAMEMNADGQFALAVFFVSYAIEFMCLTVAKVRGSTLEHQGFRVSISRVCCT
jgi:hypothetical protein